MQIIAGPEATVLKQVPDVPEPLLVALSALFTLPSLAYSAMALSYLEKLEQALQHGQCSSSLTAQGSAALTLVTFSLARLRRYISHQKVRGRRGRRGRAGRRGLRRRGTSALEFVRSFVLRDGTFEYSRFVLSSFFPCFPFFHRSKLYF